MEGKKLIIKILSLTHTDKNIAILVNPISGKGKAVTIGKALAEKLSKKTIASSLFSGEWPEDFISFTEIWLVGGDGTMNFFLNRYPENNLPLAIFKGGTGNDFAWKLYGDSTIDQQFEIALSALPQRVDAAQCNGRYFVNSSGIGFDGEVLRSIRLIRWLGGHIGYLLAVISRIFSFRESLFSIYINGMEWRERFLLVIVNNSSRTGGGFMVTPQASVNDGKIDILLCKPLSVWKRLKYLPVIEKGKHLQLPFIIYKQADKITIGAEKEQYAQLDGELICARTFEIRVIPGKLLIRY